VSALHEVPGAGGVRLTGLVIAQDEEERLGACLDSLAFCDEVLVVDGGSKDRTREVAQQRGARVLERPFDDFARQREFARAQARGRWILALDADERASPALAKAARLLADGSERGRLETVSLAVVADPGGSHTVRDTRLIEGPGDPPAAYSLPFKNHLGEVWLRHGGLWPDRHVRLFFRERCHADPARPVHEKLVVEGAIGQIDAPVIHFGWRSFAHGIEKSTGYAEAAAQALHARGKRGSIVRIFGKPLWRFLRGYVFQLGFLDGSAGALVAGLRAYEAFAREARLWELSRPAEVAAVKTK